MIKNFIRSNTQINTILSSIIISTILLFSACGQDKIINNTTYATAQLGNLAYADVRIYEIQDNGMLKFKWAETTSNGKKLEDIGKFNLHLSELEADKFYIFQISNGQDWDKDDNGIMDKKSTQNYGTIRAVAKGSDIIKVENKLHITAISEIHYQRIKSNLNNNFNKNNFQNQLDQTAKLILNADIDNSGHIDMKDILQFNPVKNKKMLSNNYQLNLNNIIANIHKGILPLNNIQLMDQPIQTPSIKKIIAELDISGDAFDLEYNDNKVYIASGDKGLFIVDINDKKRPNVIGHCDTDGWALRITLSKDKSKAYIADLHKGLAIIDITNPKNPTKLSQFTTSFDARSIALSKSDNIIYVTVDSGGLDIIDVSNPQEPTRKSNLNLAGWAKDIVVSQDGNRGYIAAGEFGLHIVDLSDNANPTFINTCEISGSAVKVVLSKDGNYVYIADEFDGLKIINVSNVSKTNKPTQLGTLEMIGYTYDIILSNDNTKVYLANGSGGIKVVDVKNPMQPNLIQEYITSDAWAILLSDDESYAYIADGSKGFKILHSPLPSHIKGCNNINLKDITLTLDGTNGLVSCGKDGLFIVRVVDGNMTKPIGKFYTNGTVIHTSLVNNNNNKSTAYIADGVGGLVILKLYNTSDMKFINHDLNITTASYVTISDDNNTAFVTSGEMLKIINITNQNSIQLRSEISLGNNALSVTISHDGKYAYVTLENHKIKIIDISNLNNPILTKLYGINEKFNFIALSNNDKKAYIANKENGLKILDINDTTNPSQLGNFNTSGSALQVVLSKYETRAYVADDNGGLKVIDITNSKNPTLLTNDCNNSYNVKALALSFDGTTTYIVGTDGLYRISINKEHEPAPSLDDCKNINMKNVVLSSDNNKAYISCGENGLFIVDISDDNINFLGKYDSNGIVMSTSLSEDGTKAYIADGKGGFKIIDISNPKIPTSIKSNLNINSASSVTLSDDNNTAFVTSKTKLYAIDISNSTPSISNSINLNKTALSVTVSHDNYHAYVTMKDHTINVININSSQLSVSKKFDKYKNYNYYFIALSKKNKNVYVASKTDGLKILDINKTNQPLLGHFNTNESFLQVVLSKDETRAYVADNDGGLKVIDIHNSANPTLLSNDSNSTYNVKALALLNNGNKVCIVGEDGIHLINIDSEPKPRTLHLNDCKYLNMKNITLSSNNDKAYISCGEDGLFIIDISNEDKITFLGKYDSNGTVIHTSISKDDTKAYIADGEAGFKIIDISNPRNPTLFHDNILPNSSDFNTLYARYVLLSNDNNTAYVLSGKHVYPIDISRSIPTRLLGRYLGGKPVSMSISHDNTKAYVASQKVYLGAALYSIDINDDYKTENIDTGEDYNFVALSNDETKLYIADNKYKTLKIMNSNDFTYIGISHDRFNIINHIVLSKDESRAYMACGTDGLQVINLKNHTDSNYPTLTNESNSTYHAKALALSNSGDKIYLVGNDGFHEILIDPELKPLAPQSLDMQISSLLKEYNNITMIDVAVSNDETKAYISCGNDGLIIADITNEKNITFIGKYQSKGFDIYTTTLSNNGQKAYLGGKDINKPFTILDISNPKNPIFIGKYSLNDIKSNNIVRNIQLSKDDTKAYLAYGQNSYVTLDIKDSKHPTLLNSYIQPNNYKINNSVLSQDEKRAFLGADKKTILTLDISDSKNNIAHSNFTLNTDDDQSSYVVLSNDETKAFVAHHSQGLIILDIKDKWVLKILGKFVTSGSTQVALSSDGTKVYLAEGDDGLKLIDISNPKNPILLGKYNYNVIHFKLSKNNKKAYIVGTDNFQIINLDTELIKEQDNKKILNPNFISKYMITNSSIMAISHNNKKAYIPTTTGMEIVDISNPKKPKRLGKYTSKNKLNPTSIKISNDGTLAYITEKNNCLLIINIKNSNNPTLLKKYQSKKLSMGNYITLSHNNTKAYLLTSEALEILDISKPNKPKLLVKFKINNDSSKYIVISKDETKAYISLKSSVAIIDINNLNNIHILGKVIDSNPKDIILSKDEKIAYVIDNNIFIKTIDITNPKEPYILDKYQTQSINLSSLAISNDGKKAYITDNSKNNGGLEILDIKNSSNIISISKHINNNNNTNHQYNKIVLSSDSKIAYILEDGILHIVDLFYKNRR